MAAIGEGMGWGGGKSDWVQFGKWSPFSNFEEGIRTSSEEGTGLNFLNVTGRILRVGLGEGGVNGY